MYAQCSTPKALWETTAGKCWDPKYLNNVDIFTGSMSGPCHGQLVGTNIMLRLLCFHGSHPGFTSCVFYLEAQIMYAKENWSDRFTGSRRSCE